MHQIIIKCVCRSFVGLVIRIFHCSSCFKVSFLKWFRFNSFCLISISLGLKSLTTSIIFLQMIYDQCVLFSLHRCDAVCVVGIQVVIIIKLIDFNDLNWLYCHIKVIGNFNNLSSNDIWSMSSVLRRCLPCSTIMVSVCFECDF